MLKRFYDFIRRSYNSFTYSHKRPIIVFDSLVSEEEIGVSEDSSRREHEVQGTSSGIEDMVKDDD